MDEPAAVGPLDGIVVVDLTTARSGPTCVRQLVDLGASAIRLGARDRADLPGSDGWNLHRGKRSVLADITRPEGREVLLKLVARADVLVENFRPGVKHRLGIGPETLWALNPGLVYGSISGFGEDGPYAERPGVDQIAQGLGGLMSVTGPPGTGPWRTGIAVTDTVAGTFLAQGIVAALFARHRTGRGQWVHTSLLETVVNIMDFQAVRVLNEGQVPGQAGNDHPTLFPMGTYPTADGHINIAGTIGFERFCSTLGHPEWATDSRFEGHAARAAHRDELTSLVHTALADRSTGQWVELLNAAGVPAGPVYALDETFADPQVQHLAMTTTVPLGDGEAVVIRHPVGLSDTPTRIAGGPPAHGAHTREVLRELGYTDAEIEELFSSGIAADHLEPNSRML